jgi:hypothetical protein
MIPKKKSPAPPPWKPKTHREGIEKVAEAFNRLKVIEAIDRGPVGQLAASVLHSPPGVVLPTATFEVFKRICDESTKATFATAVGYVLRLAMLKRSPRSNRRANAVRSAPLGSTNATFVAEIAAKYAVTTPIMSGVRRLEAAQYEPNAKSIHQFQAFFTGLTALSKNEERLDSATKENSPAVPLWLAMRAGD